MAGGPPAARPHRGGHARPRAGERAGGAAARARRDGGRGAGHPHVAAARRAARPGRRTTCVCVTSPNGAHELFARLEAAGLDARALAGRRVAAIGPGTARALGEHGIRADVVPARAVAEGLVEALAGVDVRRALLVRGREGRDVLPDALRARGADGRRPGALRDGGRAARRGDRARRRGRRLPHLHVRLDRALLPRRRGLAGRAADRLDRARDERGAARGGPRAGAGGRPAHAGRRSWPRWWPTRRDEARHAAHGLRHGGRVRRRAARRHRARGARRAGHRHHARDPARRTCCAAR